MVIPMTSLVGTEVLQSVADEASNANRGAPLALAVVVALGARTSKGRLIRSLALSQRRERREPPGAWQKTWENFSWGNMSYTTWRFLFLRKIHGETLWDNPRTGDLNPKHRDFTGKIQNLRILEAVQPEHPGSKWGFKKRKSSMMDMHLDEG